MSSPMAPTGESLKLKKRRLQGACDICRQKKIRCDSAKMPGNVCSNCLAFGAECTHFHVNQKTTYRFRSSLDDASRVSESSPLEEVRKKMDPLLTTILSSTYQAPTNPAIIRETLARLARYARTLEKAISNQGSLTPSQYATDTPSPSIHDSEHTPAVDYSDTDVENISDSLERTALLDPSSYRFFGPSSSVSLVKTAFEFSKEYVQCAQDSELGVAKHRRPEFWTVRPWEIVPPAEHKPYDFPEPDLLEHLVHIYFKTINLHYPLLHRPTIERGIKAGLHRKDRDFGSVILAICAVGSRYTDDKRVILEGTNSDLSRGFKWFNQLELFRQSFLKAPTLYELQTYCIASMYLHGGSTPEKCWYLIGIAIRAAQDVGYNRRDKDETVPSVQSELRKRVWWTLVLAESVVSANVGRPRALDPSDYDLDLPLEVDDEYWENPDPALAFKQPPGKPSTVTAFNKLLGLFDILALAQRALYSVKPDVPPDMPVDDWKQTVLAKLNESLNYWVDTVPDHLRWGPYRTDPVTFDLSGQLFSTFYYVQMLIHRPFIASRNKIALAFSSLAICTNAARALSRIMDTQSSRGFVPMPQVHIGLFLAGTMILLSIWRGKQAGLAIDIPKEMEGVHKCIKVLRMFENRWQPAGRFCDVLFALTSVTGLPLPPTSVKRTREHEETDQKIPGHTTPRKSSPEGRRSIRNLPSSRNLKASANAASSSTNTNGDTLSPLHVPDNLFQLPVYSTDLSKPIFQSYQQPNGIAPGIDDFEAMFSQPHASSAQASSSLGNVNSANMSFNNPVDLERWANGFAMPLPTQASMSRTAPDQNNFMDTVFAEMDMSIWAGVPTTYEW